MAFQQRLPDGWSGRDLRPLIGGMLSLVAAMGIGRFAYTPLLPVMQAQLHWSVSYASLLASDNYAGYLVGAITAGWLPNRGIFHRLTWVRFALVAISLSLLAMGVTTGPDWWLLWRGLAGVFSAWVIVLSSSLILDRLGRSDNAPSGGIFYAGVGLGIALTGLLVPLWTDPGNWRHGWIGLGLVSLALDAAAIVLMAPLNESTRAIMADEQGAVAHPPAFRLWGLTVAYGMEGLGYIVMATFITAFFRYLPGAPWMGDASWILVGMAAMPSTWLWTRMAQTRGSRRALLAAFGLQAVGVILPVVWANGGTAILGSLLFGGTFMGITTLALSLGRQCAPSRSQRVMATMTACFGMGQMIGPLGAGSLMHVTHAYAPALLGSGILLLGADGLLWMTRGETPADRLPP